MHNYFTTLFFLLGSCGLFAQTPVLVKDINAGVNNSNTFLNGIIFNGNYIFAATDATNGNELWITDATTANTFLVKDINPGSGDGWPGNFVIFNNTVYFTAYTAATGYELWKTDGTTNGTSLVKDIFPGSNSGFIDYNGTFFFGLTNVWEHNGSFYFIANDNNNIPYNNNIELWKSDGTTSGTVMVSDIQPGSEGSRPSRFMVFNNTLFFNAYTINNGTELWKTDGTSGGTAMVKDIFPGSNSGFIDYNGTFFFGLTNVWEHNGSFYFIANDNNNIPYNNNIELWKSDGTTSGTVMVSDIQPGSEGSRPSRFMVFNNTLFFNAYTINNGTELWKTDGTSGGTAMVKDIFPGSNSGFVDYNGTSFFGLTNVWEHNGSFYFIANDNNNIPYNNNIELWKSDGTTSGTVMVSDIQPGSEGSRPSRFMVFNNTLFFNAYTINNGTELWKTDGTSGGTAMVKDIFPGSNSGFVDYNGTFFFGLTNVWEHNGSFFFIANDNNSVVSNNNIELWKSDGTGAGTVMVKDIEPGNGGSNPRNFVQFNNELFFNAYTPSIGTELYKTDGTTGGTMLLKDIMPGSGSGIVGNFYNIFSYGNTFYFNAYELGNFDNELWKTDGTTTNTVKVHDIYSGSNGSYPNSFVILPNDHVLFLATDAANGNELWTLYLPGISQVKELTEASFSVFPNPVTSGQVTIAFSSEMQGAHTLELFDERGRLAYAHRLNATPARSVTVKLPNLPPATYYLRLTGSKGFSGTQKILIGLR